MKRYRFFFLLLFSLLIVSPSFRFLITDIPQTWNTKEIIGPHLPASETTVKVVYASESYFNLFPEHAIYQVFPVCLLENQAHACLDFFAKIKPGNPISLQ